MLKKAQEPSVIGAVIDLGLCLNLSDYGCTRVLMNSYHLLCIECSLTNTPYPQNSGKNENKLIYPSAGFRDKTHIPFCVRNPNCIKRYFAPKEPDMAFMRI